jgi:excisionase family DNA binding protein
MQPPYSVKTLAARWGCSQDTVRAMIERGDLPSFRAGGKLLRISAGAVEAWENGGASTRSDDTGSDSSRGKRSSRGATQTARTAEDWASLPVK